MQTHSDVKKYRCIKCTKTFSRMSLLNKHSINCVPITFAPSSTSTSTPTQKSSSKQQGYNQSIVAAQYSYFAAVAAAAQQQQNLKNNNHQQQPLSTEIVNIKTEV